MFQQENFSLNPPQGCKAQPRRASLGYPFVIQQPIRRPCLLERVYVVRRRGRLAPHQPLSVYALLPALREEQASTASWEPPPPFEAAEMD